MHRFYKCFAKKKLIFRCIETFFIKNKKHRQKSSKPPKSHYICGCVCRFDTKKDVERFWLVLVVCSLWCSWAFNCRFNCMSCRRTMKGRCKTNKITNLTFLKTEYCMKNFQKITELSGSWLNQQNQGKSCRFMALSPTTK
jgi:hypothetical protein